MASSHVSTITWLGKSYARRDARCAPSRYLVVSHLESAMRGWNDNTWYGLDPRQDGAPVRVHH